MSLVPSVLLTECITEQCTVKKKIFFTYLDVRKPKLKGMAPGSDICTASLFVRKSKAKTGRDNGMRLSSAFYKKPLEVVMM